MEIDHCLEVYARNLLPNFTSIGNEVNYSKPVLLILFCFFFSIGFKTSIDRFIWRDNCHIDLFCISDITMSSTTVKKVAAQTQTIDSLEALLKTNNIFLFIPNIIGKKRKLIKIWMKKKRFCLGYLRVFLSILSFYFMPTHPKITIVCYLTSEFLDALDGHAARALGQSNVRFLNMRKKMILS